MDELSLQNRKSNEQFQKYTYKNSVKVPETKKRLPALNCWQKKTSRSPMVTIFVTFEVNSSAEEIAKALFSSACRMSYRLPTALRKSLNFFPFAILTPAPNIITPRSPTTSVLRSRRILFLASLRPKTRAGRRVATSASIGSSCAER